MNYPGISVIIPTYNRFQYLEYAVNSVYTQDYLGPLQIIIVDDGSTDNTRFLIDKLLLTSKENREFLFLFQENKGSNYARNLGVERSKFDWIGFLDSDDLWEKNKLSSQFEFLKLHNFSCDVLYCGWKEVDELGEFINVNGEPSSDIITSPKKILIKDYCGPTSTILVRREKINDVGKFNIFLKARQDWELSIRLILNSRVLCMKEKLVYYRNHKGLRTNSNTNNEIFAYKWILRNHVLRSDLETVYKLQSISNYFKRKARIYSHYKKNIFKAQISIITSIVLWPFNFDHYCVFVGIYLPAGVRRIIHLKWNSLILTRDFQIKSH
jgi:glycosyltransferase involved in cell wall biosynthesis